MKKKLLISIGIICLLGCIFWYFFSSSSFAFYMTWNIWLPEPIRTSEIYPSDSRGFMDGNGFEIWAYHSQDVKKLERNQIFNPIEKEKIEILLNRYHKYLTEKEIEIYKKEFDQETLLVSTNYYAYLNDEEHPFHFCILILDTQHNRLYKLTIW